MRISYLLLTGLLILGLSAQGQEYFKKFGRVSITEIETTDYGLDEDAEAIVLFDVGKSYFLRRGDSFELIFERVTRIKILSEAGIKWGEVEIPFYYAEGIHENVHNIEAFSYNYENGRITKSELDASNAFDEKVSATRNIKKFAIPDVKKGTVIEYTYTVSSESLFNLKDWEFQWKIPVEHSEYQVWTIPFYEYSWLLQGAESFDLQTSHESESAPRLYGPLQFKDIISTYIMKEVPAFKDESFIPSLNDYIIKIDFQLSTIHRLDGSTIQVRTTWPELIQDLSKHSFFGDYVRASKRTAGKLFDKTELESKTQREKFDMVINYVKANYSWNGYNSRYASKSPKDLVREKTGNSADINLFTVGLLRAMDIESYPVLISTRKHGRIRYDYPYSHFFNYVIVKSVVDEEEIITDATEGFLAHDKIPPRCINDKGLIINKGEVKWVSLEFDETSMMQWHFSHHLNGPENTVEIRLKGDQYESLKLKKTLGTYDREIKERLVAEYPGFIDTSLVLNSKIMPENPYSVSFSIENKPEHINAKLYVAPFLEEPPQENPLKQDSRTHPLDFTYPKKRVYTASINIPEGYKADFLPEDLRISNSLFDMEYNVKQTESSVGVSLTYFFKKSVYQPANYSHIKYYFGEIVKKGNEKVVFAPL